MSFWNDMVVNHVILELHHVIPEIHVNAFMYSQNYMVDSHVILETPNTKILQLRNFKMTWLSTM